nr:MULTISPECIES: hypothetical protein [unclassified Nocardioides]
MRESTVGPMAAAAAPWTSRAASRLPGSGASPHASELVTKSAIPAVKTRRRPHRSASRLATSRRPPKVRP